MTKTPADDNPEKRSGFSSLREMNGAVPPAKKERRPLRLNAVRPTFTLMDAPDGEAQNPTSTAGAVSNAASVGVVLNPAYIVHVSSSSASIGSVCFTPSIDVSTSSAKDSNSTKPSILSGDLLRATGTLDERRFIGKAGEKREWTPSHKISVGNGE